MTVSPDQIAVGLSDALAYGGIRTESYLPDNPAPPCALVNIDKVVYHQAFQDGSTAYDFTIHVIVDRQNARTAETRLRSYMAAPGADVLSIVGLIESDETLGGLVESTTVTDSGPVAPLSVGDTGAVYLVCPFNVSVLT